MLNKKAQALIEFVLLLPIFLILIFSSIDIFNLMLEKNDLTKKLDDEINVARKKDETVEDLVKKLEASDIEVDLAQEDNYLEIKAIKEIKWISPITELILKNYKITTKRVIPVE